MQKSEVLEEQRSGQFGHGSWTQPCRPCPLLSLPSIFQFEIPHGCDCYMDVSLPRWTLCSPWLCPLRPPFCLQHILCTREGFMKNVCCRKEGVSGWMSWVVFSLPLPSLF